jgi:hypothetical protein
MMSWNFDVKDEDIRMEMHAEMNAEGYKFEEFEKPKIAFRKSKPRRYKSTFRKIKRNKPDAYWLHVW